MKKSLIITVLSLYILLPACGPSGLTPPPPVTETIGPNGGIVTAQDGKVVLEFPAGAVTEETTVTVKAASGLPAAPAGMKVVADTTFTVSADTGTFAQPVTLSIAYAEASAEAKIHITTGNTWTPLGSCTSTSVRVICDITGVGTFGILVANTGAPALKRFRVNAEGYDALLGTYNETFEGNAAYSGSLLQLFSDSETPNRILEVTYLGGGTIPVGSYRAVGSEAEIMDPAKDVVVTYTLAQGAFCTGCQPQTEPISDYYFEYAATGGTVTISQASSGKMTGALSVKLEKYSYHAELDGAFNAALGR